jgi:hypothetical protein
MYIKYIHGLCQSSLSTADYALLLVASATSYTKIRNELLNCSLHRLGTDHPQKTHQLLSNGYHVFFSGVSTHELPRNGSLIAAYLLLLCVYLSVTLWANPLQYVRVYNMHERRTKYQHWYCSWKHFEITNSLNKYAANLQFWKICNCPFIAYFPSFEQEVQGRIIYFPLTDTNRMENETIRGTTQRQTIKWSFKPPLREIHREGTRWSAKILMGDTHTDGQTQTNTQTRAQWSHEPHFTFQSKEIRLKIKGSLWEDVALCVSLWPP